MGKPKSVRKPHKTWMALMERRPTRRNSVAYAIAGTWFFLMVVTFPYFPYIHYDFVTQDVTQVIAFHLVLQANITQGTQTTHASSSFDGQLVVKGKGGVSVDNPLSLYAQVTVPSNASLILKKIVNITIAPLGAYHYPLTNNSNGIPKVEIMGLAPHGNTWTGSDKVLYSRSNTLGVLLNLTVIDIFDEQSTHHTVSSETIQVSPIDITLAINNNLLTTSLTFAILGFASLELRKDEDKKRCDNDEAKSENVQTRPSIQNPTQPEVKGKKADGKGQHQ